MATMVRPAVPLAAPVAARLRQAAAREFAALGFENASLNRIVANAGIAKSSLYHHIGGKQALLEDLLAALAGAVEEALQQLDPAPLTAATFWDAGAAALEDVMRVGRQHPELLEIAPLMHGPHGAEALLELRVSAIGRVGGYLEQGQQLGVVRGDLPPDLLAEVAVATLLAIDAWALATDPQNSEATARIALIMLRTSLEAA